MTAAYLDQNPPAVQQWYTRRNRPLTGCTVLHTAESVMDTLGPDTGAEAVAEFIRRRTTYGSYHDLVDSDSRIRLVALERGAYHDGTGSNNWALSISFACRTSDWATMGATRRAGFLRQGAAAFAVQQQWRAANGAPLTRLRRISKAQSDAGESGFIGHGDRDPGRRSDPGVRPPHLFPWDEWFTACRTALGEFMPTHPDAPAKQEEDDMFTDDDRKMLQGLSHLVDTGRHKSFVPGSETTLRGVDFWRAADAHAYRLRTEDVPRLLAELAKLRATVDVLVNREGGDVAEKLRQVLREETIRVDVQVGRDADEA